MSRPLQVPGLTFECRTVGNVVYNVILYICVVTFLNLHDKLAQPHRPP